MKTITKSWHGRHDSSSWRAIHKLILVLIDSLNYNERDGGNSMSRKHAVDIRNIMSHCGSEETDFARAVKEGLMQERKQLPCRFFYDSIGSKLFERICELPEYYLTRAEHDILERNSSEIVEVVGVDMMMVELGCGNASKTRFLIDSVLARQRSLQYIPIDIAAESLRESFNSLLNDYDELEISAIAGEYDKAISMIPSFDGPRLFLFLGSNIGNFESDEAVNFLDRLGKRLEKKDRILVGIDLVKDRGILEAAYNDSAGVTSAFNKNLLARINHDLNANFVLDRFKHEAIFIEEKSRIEMRLTSKREHHVKITMLDTTFHFESGEFIHTENSHKYSLENFSALCLRAGLEIQETWRDCRGWFAAVMLRRNC